VLENYKLNNIKPAIHGKASRTILLSHGAGITLVIYSLTLLFLGNCRFLFFRYWI